MPYSSTLISIRPETSRTAEKTSCIVILAFLALSIGLFACPASAADDSRQLEAKARYQKERAICMSGQSHQDRDTCLREAGAAYNEARQGQINGDPSVYEKNALVRCALLPQEDRQACERRIKGEGVSRGSVAEGGIYKEYKEITIPATSSQDMAAPVDSSSGSSSEGTSQEIWIRKLPD